MFPAQLFPVQLFPRETFSEPDTTNVISLSDTIVFTETLSPTGSVFHRSLTDTITFSETVSDYDLHQRLTDTIVFTETLVAAHPHVINLSDTLVFTEDLTYSQIDIQNRYNGVFPEPLFPNQIFFYKVFARTTLVGPNVYFIHINDDLGFAESNESFNPTTNTFDFTETLHLIDSFTQRIGSTHFHIHDQIRFIEQLVQFYPPITRINYSDILTFTETINVTNALHIDILDTLVFEQNSYRKNIEGININVPILIATKIVGNKTTYSSGAYGKQSGLGPVNLPYVTLQSNSQIIILPAPLFGDSLNNVGSTNINRAVDGTIYTTVKKTQRNRLKWAFDLKRQKARELDLFIQNNNLNYIYVTDWKGNYWYTRIVNNPIVFEAISRDSLHCVNYNEYHHVEIELEGFLINGPLSSTYTPVIIPTPVAPTGPAIYAAVILNVISLVSYWKMDETNGFTIVDSKDRNSGISLNNIVSNPTTTLSGLSGPCIVFNNNSYFEIPTSNNLANQQFSLELWFNPSGLSLQTLICKSDVNGFSVEMESGVLHIFTGTTTQTISATINVGVFNYLVITVSGPSGIIGTQTEARLNVNLNGSWIIEPITIIPNMLTNAPLIIGNNNLLNLPFIGSMMHIALYNVALNAAQVTQHYGLGV